MRRGRALGYLPLSLCSWGGGDRYPRNLLVTRYEFRIIFFNLYLIPALPLAPGRYFQNEWWWQFFWYRKLLHSVKVIIEYNDSFSDFMLFQLALFPSLIIWHKYWLFYIFAGSLASETSFLLPCPLLKHLKGAVFQFLGWGKPLSGPILRAVSVREEEPDFLDSDKYKFLLLNKVQLCPSRGNVQRNDRDCFAGSN